MLARNSSRLGLIIALLLLSGTRTLWADDPAWARDDFSWIRGANYVASYAATDVEMWLHYDHQTIDRELGYAERLRLNCVRVFLQSLVYHHDPDVFLANFEDFLATAAAHGLKVMPVLFDSCFGVSPSLESRHIWVANPGPDRMDSKSWSELDRYAKAVVEAHAGDSRIVMWDVMNEPTATFLAATPQGQVQIGAFVHHYCAFVKQIDNTHPITVGVAKWDNSDVLPLVDVLSCHSYAPGVEAFRADLQRTRNQARAAGKPWVVTECCNVAAGSTYEMALPVIRELGVGFFVWQVVIGRDMFNSAAGLVYPDGSVRRMEQIEAVLDRPADGFTEKPDKDGVPFGDSIPVRLAEYLEVSVDDGVTETTWRERYTQVEALLSLPHIFGEDALRARQQLETAQQHYREGRKPRAFDVVARLLVQARDNVKRSKPQVVPAKKPTATVYRDVFGIPHVYADSETAGVYALAQAQCEDMGMVVFRALRAAIGRQAEASGDGALSADKDLHLWRLPEIAERTWKLSPPRTKRFLRAFCDGLNDYRKDHLDECKDALEATPEQICALLRITDLRPSMVMVNADINAALNQPPPAMDYPNQSSTWVIGPSRTASGRPILFIDPHWPSEGPTSWWEFHLHVGRLQVGGFAMPGLPFAGLGYTNGVAWGATAGGADSADAFEINVHPDDPNRYWYDGQWRDMVVREVRLGVRTDEGSVEQRTFTFRETVHGPIVREHEGRVFAGAICGVQDTLKLRQWFAMNQASTSEELRDAFRMDQAAWLNLTYASRDGAFGYIQTGMCPLRSKDGYQKFGALDGTRSSSNWQGRLIFDDLPQVHNPGSGWLQSCNTAASYVTEGSRLSPDEFPPGALYAHQPELGDSAWRGRGLRCFQEMPEMMNVTLQRASEFALDTFAPSGPIWTKPLISAYEKFGGEVSDPDLSMRLLVNALREWDYRVGKESVGATAYRYWRSEYGKLRPNALGNNIANGFPQTEDQQRDAVQALRKAADHLKSVHGSTLVPWGTILRLRRGDLDLPLSGDTTFAGGTECLRATGSSKSDGQGHFIFVGGQVIPTVVELTDPVRVYSVVPYGQSRRPDSPHFADQTRLYSEDRMRAAWHGWGQLQFHVASRQIVEYESADQ